jgi:DNA-binding NtrC family response regulator
MNDQAKILIVDDDPAMVDTLADILSDEGFRIGKAGDGYTAVEMIKENGIDMVLMDIRMPGMDGVETFRQLKEIKPDIKVIMMTAYAMDDMIEEVRRLKAYVCLNKPLDMDNLISLVTEIALNRGSGHS